LVADEADQILLGRVQADFQQEIFEHPVLPQPIEVGSSWKVVSRLFEACSILISNFRAFEEIFEEI
jgi:hypothetical protein